MSGVWSRTDLLLPSTMKSARSQLNRALLSTTYFFFFFFFFVVLAIAASLPAEDGTASQRSGDEQFRKYHLARKVQ